MASSIYRVYFSSVSVKRGSTSLYCSVASTEPTEAEEADFLVFSGSFHFKWNLSKQIHQMKKKIISNSDLYILLQLIEETNFNQQQYIHNHYLDKNSNVIQFNFIFISQILCCEVIFLIYFSFFIQWRSDI